MLDPTRKLALYAEATIGQLNAKMTEGIIRYGRNPVAVVIPCHRLVGADGSLTGYASGLANKRWLIEHEAAGGAPARTASSCTDDHSSPDTSTGVPK